MPKRVTIPTRVSQTRDLQINFVNAEDLTITRRRSGKGWRYGQADGSRISDREEIARLNRIGLPPAYREGRFCADPAGHIQAVGTDARGRRQYRYHPDFRSGQDGAKFDRCAAFGASLPKIRAQVERDLTGSTLAFSTVVAVIIRLLDVGHLRVGNQAYAKANKSFGVTTLRNRHAQLSGKTLRLSFRAKSGIMRSVAITDKAVVRVVNKCQDLRGQNLFQYLDEDGAVHTVTSSDVNDYLRNASGENITAKDFRTWCGSVIACQAWHLASSGETQITIKQAAEIVAVQLGNTPSVARKSYIHPAVVGMISEGKLCDLPRGTHWYSPEERMLLALLEAG